MARSLIMRNVLPAAALLALAACGPKSLALPEQPIDRAATCGIVAAAKARQGTAIKSELSFEAQAGILHYPLIAGAEGAEFSAETASDVAKRMKALQERVIAGKWQELEPACRAAYPDTAKTDVTLPEDVFEAQLGCDSLGDFMDNALGAQGTQYVNELAAYGELARKLDAALGSSMAARVGSDLAAQQKARREVLAKMTKAGPPAAVMRQCIARFG